MAAIQVNRLTNANIYVNGVSKLGTAQEFTMPILKSMMSEHKAIGMTGKLELFSGVDKLEAKIKWNSFYANTMSIFANPVKAISLQVRASLETYTSSGRTAEVPVIVYVTGYAKDFPLGDFKQHDNVELESNMTVTSCKLEINGALIVEFDALANIYNIGGTDILAQYRANLGI